MATKDETLTVLAERLGFPNLDTTNTGADFKEVPVWTVREVLVRVSRPGRRTGSRASGTVADPTAGPARDRRQS